VSLFRKAIDWFGLEPRTCKLLLMVGAGSDIFVMGPGALGVVPAKSRTLGHFYSQGH